MTLPSIHVRPLAHLLRQGVVAIFAFMVPVFVVLYFITVPNGPWRVVLVAHIAATIAIATAGFNLRRAGVWANEHEIVERGFFGKLTTVPIEQIGSIVLAHTYIGGATDTAPQLFICDDQGRQLVRMRGQFWSRESMDAVTAALGVPVTVLDETLSTSELRSDFPDLLYWFERHPIWSALAFVACTAVFGAGLALVLYLTKHAS